jgi:hypothetical protein
MEQKNSGFGISAFGISIVSGIFMLIIIVTAGVMGSQPGGVDENSPIAMTVGLAMFFFLFLDMIAVMLGIIGLFQQDRKKLFAVLGIAIASLTILGTLGLMLIGLTMA